MVLSRPSRELQDTFYLSDPSTSLPPPSDYYKRVSRQLQDTFYLSDPSTSLPPPSDYYKRVSHQLQDTFYLSDPSTSLPLPSDYCERVSHELQDTFYLFGFLCPLHTPDGSPCGLPNHLLRALPHYHGSSFRCRNSW
ncbi:hypothetical protein CY34DRAFT_19095 [Suillus luteus UH-Slu-Lm8-n1]|uniref:DNA-directed RNA polymerase n=1 Tax=Suillus luteus UH-Slu-Lm8-n1 TaxID=930992 RepID=A0A0D0A2J1_9AGAM|nr:hypothetical protein CY34DRAFT_19095 [Suillus luteus UH-Slu-Lm8-n1]